MVDKPPDLVYLKATVSQKQTMNFFNYQNTLIWVTKVETTNLILIQYVYINCSTTGGRSTGWRQISLVQLTKRWEMIRPRFKNFTGICRSNKWLCSSVIWKNFTSWVFGYEGKDLPHYQSPWQWLGSKNQNKIGNIYLVKYRKYLPLNLFSWH